jgi:hypothetical protein
MPRTLRYSFVVALIICALFVGAILSVPQVQAQTNTMYQAGFFEGPLCGPFGWLVRPLGLCQRVVVQSPAPEVVAQLPAVVPVATPPQPSAATSTPTNPTTTVTERVIERTPVNEYITNEYVTNPTTVIQEVVEREIIREESQRRDMSDYVTEGLFDNQVDSIFESMGERFASIGDSFATNLLTVTGSLRDSTLSAGLSGMVLQSTGTGVEWVATSTLGISGGGGGSSLFTHVGATTYLTSLADNLAIGTVTATPNVKLTVAGNIDIADPSAGISVQGIRVFHSSSSRGLLAIGEGALEFATSTFIIDKDTVSIGTRAGQYMGAMGNEFSSANVYLGYEAGRFANGSEGTVVGWRAAENYSGYQSTFLGSRAGLNSQGSYGVVIGAQAGSQTSGDGMVIIGAESAQNLLFGDESISIGYAALASSLSATRTIAIGPYALAGGNGNTQQNMALGYAAGASVTTGGDNNLLIGYQAADSLTTGANNIIIGYDVEAPSNTGSNQLNIGNMIFGTGIDGTGTTLSSGNVGIGTTSPLGKLHLFSGSSNGALPNINSDDLVIENNSNVGITLSSPSNQQGFVSFGDSESSTSGLISYNHSFDQMGFWTDGQQRMRLNNGGGVAINKNSINTAMLDIQATGTVDILNLYETDGEEVFTVLENGNVGIGTTTPDSKLDVNGNITARGTLTVIGPSGVGNITLQGYRNSSVTQTIFQGLGARGTEASPLPVLENDSIFRIAGSGWNNNGYKSFAGSYGAEIKFIADADFTGDNNMPTRIEFSTIDPGGDFANTNLTIDSSGMVGIGTSSPNNKLEVFGGNVSFQEDAASLLRTLDFDPAPGSISHSYGAGIRYELARDLAGSGKTGIGFGVGGIDTNLYRESANLLRTDDNFTVDQNVGIGTTTSTSRLTVQSTGTTDILNLFETSGQEVFTVLENGNVGLGTSTPDSKLTLYGNTETPLTLHRNSGNPVAIQFRTAGGIDDGKIGLVNDDALGLGVSAGGTTDGVVLGGWDQRFFIGIGGGGSRTEAMRLNQFGSLGIGTTTPSAQLTVQNTVRFAGITGGTLETDALGNVTVSSDERLKDISGVYAAGLDEVLALRPIEYRWNKESGYDTATVYAGFSAQNVEEFIPEAVGENGDGFKTLSTRPILAALVTAVQEMWEMVTGNTTAIESLESENEALRERLEAVEAKLDIEVEEPEVVMEDTTRSIIVSTAESTEPEADTGSTTDVVVDEEPVVEEDVLDDAVSEVVVKEEAEEVTKESLGPEPAVEEIVEVVEVETEEAPAPPEVAL